MMKHLPHSLWMVIAAFFFAGAAHAQATRTWVSGVGDDVNPCSRTAPCKTFAGAISKTATGGEISVLDPGGFGAVTITKSITLDGQGQLAGILSAGTNGITVNASGSSVIVIRNLSIDGAGSGLDGIAYTAAGQLIVDNVAISGITLSGIEVLASATGGKLIVTNTTITGGASGVKVAATVNASLDKVSIRGAVTGIDALLGNVDVFNSNISQNTGFGVLAEGGSIDLENSTLTGNQVAVQSATGSLVRMTNSSFYNNLTGFGCGGGVLASNNNNRKAGNVGGSIAVCAPTATISLQ